MTVELQELGSKMEELAESAAGGEDVILAREGRPLVKLTPISPSFESMPEIPIRRLGFLEGEFKVPADFDTMFEKEIDEMFNGESPA